MGNIRQWAAGHVGAAGLLCGMLVIAGCRRDATGEHAPQQRGWVRVAPRGNELAWTPSETLAELTPSYHALVVGINAYRKAGADGWEPLVTARGDAEAIGDILAQTYGFSVTRLLDGQASRQAIMTALDGYVGLTANDAVLLYFAGHGFYDEALDEGYWIPADARRVVGDRLAREEWLWNSTIKKMLGASRARHVFVIADSCFSGSLFRGGSLSTPTPNDLNWYRRAMAKPSRYLLTSGDIEPVMDSGLKHSIFARQVIDYLTYPERSVFAASDLGAAVRQRVSTLTGQMVRSGPLGVASHAGGEFVFIRNPPTDVALRRVQVTPPAAVEAVAVEPVRVVAVAAPPADALRDAVVLRSQGAVQAAQSLVAEVATGHGDDALVRAVQAHLDVQEQARRHEAVTMLIDSLQERARTRAAAGAGNAEVWSARPRIVACLGVRPRGGGAAAAATALLASICLQSELGSHDELVVVEREILTELLQEMNLGSSDLADRRAQLEIGRLLPASVLILGDLIPSTAGPSLFLRLVDTETTRVMGSVSAKVTNDNELGAACADLAKQAAERVIHAKPLSAGVISRNGARLEAGIGAFHRAAPSMQFTVWERTSLEPGGKGGPVRRVGDARIDALGEEVSRFTVAWVDGVGELDVRRLWLEQIVTP